MAEVQLAKTLAAAAVVMLASAALAAPLALGEVLGGDPESFRPEWEKLVLVLVLGLLNDA